MGHFANRFAAGATALVLWPGTAVQAAPAEVVDLADITPRCDKPFELNDEKSACRPNDDSFARLSQADCERTVGAAWDAGACKPAADAAQFPKPHCGSQLADLAYDAQKKSCQVVRGTPRSSLGDFVGDCFKVQSPPPEGIGNGLASGSYFVVESQTRIAGDDKELVVSPAKPFDLFGLHLACRYTGAREFRVNASTLVASGAHRYGWSYGVLILPFKYHRHDKSFTPGSLNVGPFLGRRWGSAGSAITLAAAATVGSVRGEERDAAGNVTGTPDLTAFSVALGLMYDVSKNPDLKPFKMGVFWGNDRVSQTDAVKYVHNRKPWVAFQIGFDFTDTK